MSPSTPPSRTADTTAAATAGCPDDDTASVRPGAAARCRTLAAHAASAILDLPGSVGEEQVVPAARLVEPDGSVLLLLPPEIGAAVLTARDDIAAVLHLVDVAPVAVPHRVRAHCWIAGWLSVPVGADLGQAAARLAAVVPDPAMLAFGAGRSGAVVRLEPGEVLVDDLWGAEHVEPDEYAAAAPDPLAAHESELLQHLAGAHADELLRLCVRVGACGPDAQAVPVALDRHGIRLRCSTADATRDVRFEFRAPVAEPAALGEALRALVRGPEGPGGCARAAGEH